jgi:hypothetical protein
MSTRLPDELVYNVEKCEASCNTSAYIGSNGSDRKPTKAEESPLVATLDKGANESSNNHDLVDDDDPQERGPRHASGEQQVEQKKGRCNEPVNVSHVVDRAV